MSRELFEKWCDKAQNGGIDCFEVFDIHKQIDFSVVIPGYCVEGTMARVALTGPKTITKLNGISYSLLEIERESI